MYNSLEYTESYINQHSNELLEFASQIANDYSNISDGHYVSSDHHFHIAKLGFLEGIDVDKRNPVRVGNQSYQVQINSFVDVSKYSFSSILFWIVWGFHRKQVQTDLDCDMKTYKFLEDYPKFNILAMQGETNGIFVEQHEQNLERLKYLADPKNYAGKIVG